MKIERLMCASAAVALTVACGASMEAEPVSTTTTTSAFVEGPGSVAAPLRPASGQRAIDEIATARCTREYECGNVGLGKSWTSYGECVRGVREAKRSTLVGQSCDRGIDPYLLERCIDATRNTSCGPAISVSRFASCSAMDLCL